MSKHKTPLWAAAWVLSSVLCFGSLNALAEAEPAPCSSMDSRQQTALIALISIMPGVNVIVALVPTGFVEYGLKYSAMRCRP